MRLVAKWIIGPSLLIPALVACSGSKNNPLGGDDGTQIFGGGDDSGAGGTFTPYDGGQTGGDQGPCKGGLYKGSFIGSYSSHLTVVGVPIPVTGDVNLNLEQQGSSEQMCVFEGESERCSDLFTLKDGTITGSADLLFGYFCVMTGTLDCMNKKLKEGWIQCHYCAGPVFDDAGACIGLGGFARPITADYDYGTLGFVNGSWGGAEALDGMDAGAPNASMYLNDAGYLGPGNYGGSGTWNAKHQ